MPRFHTLEEWLAWQESLHPVAIELGLERVTRVARELDCLAPAPVVITVGGTNGKGSSLAMLEAILCRAGYRTGCYTSPHLLHYNERLRIDEAVLEDADWCESFARVDAARGGISLTYFEFGTLAALDLMGRAGVDVALLEVGLGGRLDAVNIVDADLAMVTSVGLDHTEWLGDNRDAIGREKAGIFRPGRPAICVDADPPDGLLQAAAATGARLSVLGRDFHLRHDGPRWHWQGARAHWQDLPRPALPGMHQLANAAGVLAALECLHQHLPVNEQAVVAGLKWARLPGRIERLAGKVEQVLDVAHNAQAAEALADALRHWPVAGRTHAVIGMLADKDIAGFVRQLAPRVQHWLAVDLPLPRAEPAAGLARRLRAQTAGEVSVCASVAEAHSRLAGQAVAGDRILVCGSFYTVAGWKALPAICETDKPD
ncbi:MAG TPA: bifunctional tetrahydrofolate synthase/dihydrofolate synthase [Gammaproteobacteria bacterium]|nr:bifunctional tetrahydrofolate synthase/dihydrofolate synthase [Gammaproteobacteria bacterium]